MTTITRTICAVFVPEPHPGSLVVLPGTVVAFVALWLAWVWA